MTVLRKDARMEREFLCTARWLNLAVTERGPKSQIRLKENGRPLMHFRARLAQDAPDFFVAADMESCLGKTVTIEVTDYPGEDPFAKISLDDRRTGHERIYHEELRPRFHYSAICGWLNDPNGLLYYRGTWFLFAQLNPYFRWCDNMHWQMAVSSDLFHWRDCGLPLRPDERGQKFSGSGIVDKKNVTGLKEGDDDPILLFHTTAGDIFTQDLVYSTDGGKTFRAYAHNPILPQLAPANRDPKVIPHPNGSGYLMALYLSGNDYCLLRSADLLHWEKTCTLTVPGCVECPDIYEIALDGDPARRKMIFSCAGGEYLVGHMEGDRFVPETQPQCCFAVPGTRTAYAPQSFYDAPDGRRVQIICTSNQTMLPGEAFGKFLTLPCELTLHTVDGGMKLFSNPVRELRQLECALLTEHEHLICTAPYRIPTPDSGLFRAEFTVPAACRETLVLHIFNRRILYCGARHTVEYDGAAFALHPQGEQVVFDLVVDRCSAELFAGGGEVYLPVVCPFDKSLPAFVLESTAPVPISELRVAELPCLLPWSDV